MPSSDSSVWFLFLWVLSPWLPWLAVWVNTLKACWYISPWQWATHSWSHTHTHTQRLWLRCCKGSETYTHLRNKTAITWLRTQRRSPGGHFVSVTNVLTFVVTDDKKRKKLLYWLESCRCRQTTHRQRYSIVHTVRLHPSRRFNILFSSVFVAFVDFCVFVGLPCSRPTNTHQL